MIGGLAARRGVRMGRPSKYTPEFREEAVRLHREQGGPVAETARRLGLHTETFR
jgi:transposase